MDNGSRNSKTGRRVTFEEPISRFPDSDDGNRHEADDLDYDDEDSDMPSEEGEEDIEEIDAFDEEEDDEVEEYNPEDDGPSTSAGPSRSRLSKDMKAALMSTETEDLLKEMKSAYEKKRSQKRRRQPAGHVDDDESPASDDIQEDVSQEFLDDPLDEDYFPQEKMRRRARAKRRLQELAANGTMASKKGDVTPKVGSRKTKRLANTEVTDYSDWTENEDNHFRTVSCLLCFLPN